MNIFEFINIFLNNWPSVAKADSSLWNVFKLKNVVLFRHKFLFRGKYIQSVCTITSEISLTFYVLPFGFRFISYDRLLQYILIWWNISSKLSRNEKLCICRESLQCSLYLPADIINYSSFFIIKISSHGWFISFKDIKSLLR